MVETCFWDSLRNKTTSLKRLIWSYETCFMSDRAAHLYVNVYDNLSSKTTFIKDHYSRHKTIGRFMKCK